MQLRVSRAYFGAGRLSFGEDGRTIIAVDGNDAVVFDLAGGEKLLVLRSVPSRPIERAMFVPGGRILTTYPHVVLG